MRAYGVEALPPHEIEVLSTLPIFGGLDRVALDKVIELCTARFVVAGESVLNEGDPARELFIIRSGSMRVVAALGSPKEHLLAELGIGDCFGEMALIDIEPRSASVIAACASELLRLERSDFLTLQAWNLETYTLIILNMAREISRRLRAADALIVESGIRNQRG